MAFSLKKLRAGAKNEQAQDLGLDATANALMLMVIAWFVAHLVFWEFDVIAAGVMSLGGVFGIFMVGAMLSGVFEASEVSLQWTDAAGYNIGLVAITALSTYWYPYRLALTLLALGLLAFWPIFLRHRERFKIKRREGLPEGLVEASVALPTLKAPLRAQVEAALTAYTDVADAAQSLPESARYLLAEAEATVLGVIAHARTVHRLGERDSPTLVEARTLAEQKIEAMLLGLDELLAAVALHDGLQSAESLAKLEARTADLRHLAEAHAELDAL